MNKYSFNLKVFNNIDLLIKYSILFLSFLLEQDLNIEFLISSQLNDYFVIYYKF